MYGIPHPCEPQNQHMGGPILLHQVKLAVQCPPVGTMASEKWHIHRDGEVSFSSSLFPHTSEVPLSPRDPVSHLSTKFSHLWNLDSALLPQSQLKTPLKTQGG